MALRETEGGGGVGVGGWKGDRSFGKEIQNGQRWWGSGRVVAQLALIQKKSCLSSFSFFFLSVLTQTLPHPI